jgi:NADPH2:quinone reductase
MKAIQMTKTGGPEVMELREAPMPEPGSGQVLVKIEAAGVVAALGPEVTGFKVGDRVAWCHVLGAYAEYAAVPVSMLIAIPDGVTMQQGAAALLQGMTAHYLSHSTYAIKTGDMVLIHAGAGGVGLLLIQMAKRLGARVLTTVSTDAKAALARGAGADEVILYTQEDFAARTRELTKGEGVAVVYDSVGMTTFDGSLACLQPRGLMALYGGSSGAVPPFDLIQLSQRGSLYITRPTLKDYTATREELERRAGEVLGWVADGSLKLRIEHTYPLAEAAQAHRDLEGRQTTGKLLLVP